MRRIPLSDDDELDPWDGPTEDPEFGELDFNDPKPRNGFGETEEEFEEALGDRVDELVIDDEEEEERKKTGDDDLQAIVQYLEEV